MAHKKPAHLKVITGSERIDAVATLVSDPLSEAPEPVDWLPNAHAVKEWRRLCPFLIANKLLSESDLVTFGHLCAVHGKMVQVWLSGESPVAATIAQYTHLAAAFGLAPAWRSKIKTNGDKGTANTFAKLKDKSAG